MKLISMIVAAGATGLLTSAAAIQALHAQAKPPANLVAEVEGSPFKKRS